MGKPTGFLDHARIEDPFRPAENRLLDFLDLHEPLCEEKRRQQAERCMNCAVPFCQSDYGCPLHNRIPEWNDLLCRGLEKQALARLLQTAPFPEFTDHVCPALCEKACNLSEDGVTNRNNELYLIEKGFSEGWIEPRIPATHTGKAVAVVGSGPSGLAAADLLNQLGYRVTVFERADRPGGLLMYGIPAMKLPKELIERRIRLMEKEGITFRLGKEADPSLLSGFDAVVLCGGAKKPRSLSMENADTPGIVYAVDYLTEQTKALLDGRPSGISAEGKAVVVVGGGDTGNDCIGTALRQGCRSILQLEMMPAPPEERLPSNPWPEWPRVLKTDYGQVEAESVFGQDPRRYQTTVTKAIPGPDGMLSAIGIVRLMRDENGRMVPVPGTEETVPCELLLIAAGFVGCEETLPKALGLPLGRRGTLMPENQSHQIKDKYFSAGDMRTGQSLVVRALADGRAAALEVHAYLQKENEQ